MGKKKLKVISFIFVSLMILSLIGTPTVSWLVNSKFRDDIEAKIQETLHRKADIGYIHLTLWTGPGAKVKGFTILGKDGSQALIQAEQMVVRIRWIPFLFSIGKKIQLSAFTLKNPKFFLERTEEGIWNFEDILPVRSTTAAHSEGRKQKSLNSLGGSVQKVASNTSPPDLALTLDAPVTDPANTNPNGLKSFSINTFNIVDGTVTVQDRVVNKETIFSNISLEAQNITPGSKVPFSLSTEVNGEKTSKIEASGIVGPIPQNGGLEEIGFELKARLEEFILSRFAPYYKKQLGAEFIDGELGGEVKLTGKLGAYLNSEGKLEVTDFLWKDPQVFTSPLKGIHATLNGNFLINFLDNDFKLINSSLVTPALMVDVSGEVQEMKTKPQLNLSIKLENLAWEKLLTLFPSGILPDLIGTSGLSPLRLGGIANINLQPQGSFTDLKLTGTVDLNESHVQYKDLFLKPPGVPGQLAFEAHLEENGLSLSSLLINLNQVQVKAEGSIEDLKTQEPSIDLKVTSQPFLPEKLVELFPNIAGAQSGETIKVSGPGSLELTVKGRPKDLLVEGKINLDQSELMYGSKFRKAPNIQTNLEFSSQRKEDTFNLKNLALQVGTLTLNVAGTVTNFAAPSIWFDLTTNKFELNTLQQQLMPAAAPLLPSDVILTGPTELKLHAEGPVDRLQVVTNLNLTENGITYKDIFAKPVKKKLDLKVNTELDAGKLNIDNVVLSLGDMVVTTTGTLGSLSDPSLDLQVSTNTFSLDTLLEAIPIAAKGLPGELALTGKANLGIKSSGKLEDLNLTGTINLDESHVQYGQVFKKLEGVPGNLNFNAGIKKDETEGSPSLNIANFLIQLGNLAVRVNGSVSNFQDPKLNLDVNTNPFDVVEFQDKLLPGLSLPGLTLTGASQLQVHVEGPLQALEIKSGLNLTKNFIRYEDFFVKPEGTKSELNLNAGLHNGDISIKNLALLLEDLELTAKGTLSKLQSEPLLNLEVLTNEFDVQKLLQKSPVAETSLPPDLSLTGSGKLTIKTEGILSNLRLTGLINMDKGEVGYGNMFKKASGVPGRLEFDTMLKRNRFEIETLKLNINDMVLDIKGFITSFEAPRLDLRLKSNTFAFNQLVSFPGLQNDSGKVDLNLRLKGKWKDLTKGQGITGTVNFKNVQLMIPEWSVPIENLTASAVLTGKEVNIKGLTAHLGSSAFTGNLTIQDLTTPNVQFDLHSPNLNLDELLEKTGTEKKTSRKEGLGMQKPEGIQIASTLPTLETLTSETRIVFVREEKALEPESAAVPIADPEKKVLKTSTEEDLLKRMQAQGVITVAQGTVKKLDFTQLATQVQMLDKIIKLNDLVFNFYDGIHQGSAIIDLNPPQPIYEVNTQLTQVNTDKLLTEKTQLKHIIYGLLFANMNLQGQGFSQENVNRTLVGRGDLEILNGKFTAFSIFHEIAPLFELLGRVGKAKELFRLAEQFKATPKDTKFSLFKGHFNIQNGQADTGDLVIEVHDPDQNLKMILEIIGTLGLADTTLDLVGKLTFFEDFKYYPELIKYFPEQNGKVTIPFPIPIQGTLLQPEFSLTSVEASVVKFAADMAVQRGIQLGLEKILKKREKKVEENLEPQPDSSPETLPEEKPSTSKKSEDMLEDISREILDQIFKKKNKEK